VQTTLAFDPNVDPALGSGPEEQINRTGCHGRACYNGRCSWLESQGAFPAVVERGGGETGGAPFLELAHEGDHVLGVGIIRQTFSDHLVGLVSEDAAHAGGDIEEAAFEGDDMDEIGQSLEKQEVQQLIVSDGTRVCLWADGGGDGCGRRGERDGGEKGRVGEKQLEVAGDADRGDELGPLVSEGGWMGGVVDEVAAVAQLLEDGVGLLGEVDLEADVVDDVGVLVGETCEAAEDGDDGDEVDKGGAVLPVVEDGGLALLVGGEVLLEVGDGGGVGEEAGLSAVDEAGGGLEEAAVAAEDLVLGVAGEAAEGRGAVDDRVVKSADVDDDERAREVDRAEVDTRMGAVGDAGEDGEEVEAGGGVHGQAEGRGGLGGEARVKVEGGGERGGERGRLLGRTVAVVGRAQRGKAVVAEPGVGEAVVGEEADREDLGAAARGQRRGGGADKGGQLEEVGGHAILVARTAALMGRMTSHVLSCIYAAVCPDSATLPFFTSHSSH